MKRPKGVVDTDSKAESKEYDFVQKNGDRWSSSRV